MGRRQTHCLTEFVVLVETCLASFDDLAAASDHIANSPAADNGSADAKAADLQRSAYE